MSALEIRGLGHHFDDVRVLRDIDLCVAPGEVRALIGPNGAGKSTLMRAALDMLRPDAGSVRLRFSAASGASSCVPVAGEASFLHVIFLPSPALCRRAVTLGSGAPRLAEGTALAATLHLRRAWRIVAKRITWCVPVHRGTPAGRNLRHEFRSIPPSPRLEVGGGPVEE